MNDYFNNLAIRTVSRGDVVQGNLVQPRMASVYEPQGMMESTVEAVSETVGTLPHTNSTNEVKRISSFPVTRTLETTNSPATLTEAKEESLAAVPFAELTTAVEEVDQVEQVDPIETVKTIVEPEKELVGVSTKPHVEHAAIPDLEPVERVDSVLKNPKKTPQAERATIPSVRSVFQEAETLKSTHHFTEHLIKQTQHTQQTQHTKQTSSRREQFLLESQPEPEPSINVTIGRIEVRAVPTAGPKQKPARTASPVMPLEDYLRKQRRGDER